MYELCRFILVLTTFMDKMNFSRGGGILGSGKKLRHWRGFPPLPVTICTLDPNPLPLSGWRSVGMRFWTTQSCILKEELLIIILTCSNYLLNNSTVIFSSYITLCIQRGRMTNENSSVGEFRLFFPKFLK